VGQASGQTGVCPATARPTLMHISRGAVGALKHQVNHENGCLEHPQKPEESLKIGVRGRAAIGDHHSTRETRQLASDQFHSV